MYVCGVFDSTHDAHFFLASLGPPAVEKKEAPFLLLTRPLLLQLPRRATRGPSRDFTRDIFAKGRKGGGEQQQITRTVASLLLLACVCV